MVAKDRELKHIRRGQRVTGLSLLLEKSDTRKDEVDEGFEFRGLEAPPQQSISHIPHTKA